MRTVKLQYYPRVFERDCDPFEDCDTVIDNTRIMRTEIYFENGTPNETINHYMWFLHNSGIVYTYKWEIGDNQPE